MMFLLVEPFERSRERALTPITGDARSLVFQPPQQGADRIIWDNGVKTTAAGPGAASAAAKCRIDPRLHFAIDGKREMALTGRDLVRYAGDASVAQRRNTRCQVVELRGGVGGEQDGAPPVSRRRETIDEKPHANRIEVHRRLIEQVYGSVGNEE